MTTLDTVLACTSCGMKFAGPVGQVASGAVDLFRFAMKRGWLPDGFGGVIDPTCAQKEGVRAGMAAAIASALTSERMRQRGGAVGVGKRLGRLPTKHDPHGRTLRLEKYLTPDLLADPPDRVDWSAAMTDIGIMGNDVLSNCAFAMAGHMIQAWTSANGQQVIVSDQDIVTAYSAVTGYVPGDPSTDNGTYMLDLLNYWRQVGIGGHKIAAFVAVDPTDKRMMEIAINLFGGVAVGLALPLTAEGQEVWTLPAGGTTGRGAPGGWGGHAVPLLNEGPGGFVDVTWGALKTASHAFAGAYVEEAYAVLSAADWSSGDRPAPNGFKLDALLADLSRVAG